MPSTNPPTRISHHPKPPPQDQPSKAHAPTQHPSTTTSHPRPLHQPAQQQQPHAAEPQAPTAYGYPHGTPPTRKRPPKPQNPAIPTLPDQTDHTHPNPNHLPETGRSFPLTTTLRTSTTTALLPLARFGGPPCPNATTPAKGSRRDPWSDGFDTDCSFVAVRLNHPLPPVPVGVRTAAGPPCFSGRPR